MSSPAITFPATRRSINVVAAPWSVIGAKDRATHGRILLPIRSNAVSLDTVVRLAAIVAALFVVSGIASAIVIRKVVGKLLSIGVCLVVAVLFWTQRANIQHCANQATIGDSTCHFFWFDVNVPSPADEVRGG